MRGGYWWLWSTLIVAGLAVVAMVAAGYAYGLYALALAQVR